MLRSHLEIFSHRSLSKNSQKLFFPLESSQWCDREDCAPTELTDRQLSPNVVVCLHSYASTRCFPVASLKTNETEPNGYKLLKFVHKSRITNVCTVQVYRKCMYIEYVHQRVSAHVKALLVISSQQAHDTR